MFGIVVEIQGRPAGLHSRTGPRGQDEKGAIAGTRVEPRRQTMARSLWICPRRPARRQGRDKKTSKEDKRTERQTERGGAGGEGRAGTSPAGALAHLPCCHTNGDTIRVGLKDGGGRFFLSGGRGVMEGQKRTKGAGSCQGKRDGSGKTGTDLNGRHLLGYAGCFFFSPAFLLTPWEARGEGWWKVGTRGKGKWSCCGRPQMDGPERV